MTPVALPKMNPLFNKLTDCFSHEAHLSDFEKHTIRKEIDDIAKIHPEAALLFRGFLAAITNNQQEVLRLSKTALAQGVQFESFFNWSNLLSNLGLMREAYAFIQKAWVLSPLNMEGLDALILLARAFDDAPKLEEALIAWQRLNPGKLHPLLAVHALKEMEKEGLDDETLLSLIASSMAGMVPTQRMFGTSRRMENLVIPPKGTEEE